MNHEENSAPGESVFKHLYTYSSRRSAIVRVGKMCLKALGISMLPLLPVDRIVREADAQSNPCSSWFLCAIYGRLCGAANCSCGTTNSCPSCATSGSFWQKCCQYGSGYSTVQYIDCCSSSQTCVNSCSTCPFALMESKSQLGAEELCSTSVPMSRSNLVVHKWAQ